MVNSPAVAPPRIEWDCDLLVIGSGIAGCAAALEAASQGLEVTVITKASDPFRSSSDLAQGGIATVGPDDDPASFEADISAAGQYAGQPDAIQTLVRDGVRAVRETLINRLDVPFDRTRAGEFAWGREAAHSKRRILHAGDRTGHIILKRLLQAVQTETNIDLQCGWMAVELERSDETVVGARLLGPEGPSVIHAKSTLLATGGIGGLYGRTTNPSHATGDGIAMAMHAGAETVDLHYVQFHPTVFDGEPPFLVSEAVRGEGAFLVNSDGERFMKHVAPDQQDLAPRDIVARSVEMERRRTGRVFLNLRPAGDWPQLKNRFPQLYHNLEQTGWFSDDPPVPDLYHIPVRPAQHFLCGGVKVDLNGQTTVPGLYAAGETACSGVHGANRLASTSLLEGLVWGQRAARHVASHHAGQQSDRPPEPEAWKPNTFDEPLPSRFSETKQRRIQSIMWQSMGLIRTQAGLERAHRQMLQLRGEAAAFVRGRTDPRLFRLHHATEVSLMMIKMAGQHPSLGCHYLENDTTTRKTAGDQGSLGKYSN